MPRLGYMPAPKTPTTFDSHLGAVVNGLAKPHGGREWLAPLLGVSKKTVDRKMAGGTSLLVKELTVVAKAVHSTPEEIVDQALRNYGDGDREVGLRLVRAELESHVQGVTEDDYEVTPGGPKADLALAANQRRKKVDTPAAE